jgi:hypothetical protein
MMMPMWKFRLLEWLGGFLYLAQGLAQIVSFGFWLPHWTTAYNLWVCDLDE